MTTQNVMDDGYTKQGYIAKPEGFDADLHQGMEFAFRPMRVEEVEELALAMNREAARGDATKATLLEALALSKRIVSWSEVDGNGATRPITLETVRRLPPTLYRRVRNIIAGISGSDPRPNQPTNEPQSELEKELEAAMKGQTPGQVVENQVGNSVAG